MPASGPPVVIVPSGGFPVTQVPSGANGAAPFTVVGSFVGLPITLISSGGFPMTLLDAAGADYSTGPDVTAPTIASPATGNNIEGIVLAHLLSANEAVTWTITGGADQARFELSGATLRWASNGVKDFEAPDDSGTNNTYVVQITATDAALNATNQTITITVTDAAEDVTAPTITSSATGNNIEGVVLAHALTANEAVTWTITGGADQARFELSGSTLRWASNGVKNFEIPDDVGTNNTYVIQITATDAALNSTNQTITITVTDVDEVAPTITSSAAVNLAENTALSHALTANEAVTWTKTGGADAALFTLTGSTLSMIAKNFEIPVDADASNTYVVQITATDTALNATNQTITVTVTDVVDEGGGGDGSMHFNLADQSGLLALLEDI